MLTNIGKVDYSKYNSLLEIYKRQKLTSSIIVLFIECNTHFIWSKINYRYYWWLLQCLTVLIQFLSNIVLIIPFFTAYTSLSCYFLGIYCSWLLSSGIYDWRTNIINHKRAHISLLIIFRRINVSLGWCLLVCCVFLPMVSEDNQRIIFHVCIRSTESVALENLILRVDTVPHTDTNQDISTYYHYHHLRHIITLHLR